MSTWLVVSGFLAIGLIPATTSFGEVDLGFTISNATPSSITVATGSAFVLSVVIHSSSSAVADQITGLDYHLDSSASNVFSISSRNSTTVNSAFSQTDGTDASVAGQALNPSTQMDLGAVTTNWPTPVANGIFEVADYKILVSPTAAKTNYTFAFLNTLYQGPASTGFMDNSFASLGSFNVTVVAPEPGCLGVLCLSCIGLGRRPAQRKV